MSLFGIKETSEIKPEYGEVIYKLTNKKLNKSVKILATRNYSNEQIGRFTERVARHFCWNLPDCIMTNEGAPKRPQVTVIFDECKNIDWGSVLKMEVSHGK